MEPVPASRHIRLPLGKDIPKTCADIEKNIEIYGQL
jgi:hypothetical protein